MNYLLHLGIVWCIYAILSLSFNVVFAFCGRLTLAHASYLALGAYVYAVCSTRLSLNFPVILLVAATIGGLASLPLSVLANRLRGDFFVMGSLAIQTFLLSLYTNWYSTGARLGDWTNMTNGSFGIRDLPPIATLSIGFDTNAITFAAALALLMLISTFHQLLLKAPWGRTLIAIRDDEPAARGLGKRVYRFKHQAFLVSGAIAAVAGALYAAHIRYVHPALASLEHSILILTMVVVGGAGNLRGPLLGAAILVGLPEFLRALSIPDTMAANIRVMVFGLLLIVLVHTRPKGLAGDYRVDR